MTFKVLALVVEQFWHVYWISYCKKYLVNKCEIFTPFCYTYIQVTDCKKIGLLDLSLIKLLQNEQGCIFCLTVYMYTLWGIQIAKLYHGMKIFGTYMHKRISHHLSVCKINNWEPAYQICYCLLMNNNVKSETVAATRDSRLHHSRPTCMAS